MSKCCAAKASGVGKQGSYHFYFDFVLLQRDILSTNKLHLRALLLYGN